MAVTFTVAQAAQKWFEIARACPNVFTAAQAAQKLCVFVHLLIGIVHCRTGSSENKVRRKKDSLQRSLPHRQLRKAPGVCSCAFYSSLPHRQLRNTESLGTASFGLFTAAQAAQKTIREISIRSNMFTAAQAAQKVGTRTPNSPKKFTAAQAAQKRLSLVYLKQ